MRSEWEAASVLTGHEVEVVGGGASITGRVRGVDDDGALLLSAADGGSRRVIAGEVSVRRGVGR